MVNEELCTSQSRLDVDKPLSVVSGQRSAKEGTAYGRFAPYFDGLRRMDIVRSRIIESG